MSLRGKKILKKCQEINFLLGKVYPKIKIILRRPGNSLYNDADWTAESMSTSIFQFLLNEELENVLNENMEERRLHLKIFKDMYGHDNQFGSTELERVSKIFNQLINTQKTLIDEEEKSCGLCFKHVDTAEPFYCYLKQNQLCANGKKIHIMCSSCKWSLVNESLVSNLPSFSPGYCQNCFSNIGGDYEFICNKNFC